MLLFIGCSSSQDEESFDKKNNQSDKTSHISTKPIAKDKPITAIDQNQSKPQTPKLTNIQMALLDGNSTKVTKDEVIDATLDEFENINNYLLDAKKKIFNLDNNNTSLEDVTWDPTHDAMFFKTTLGINTPILVTNGVSLEGKTIYHKTLGAIGERGDGRYMILGGNPMRVRGNDEMDKVMQNSISWLTRKDNLKESKFNVILAQLDESHFFKDESKTRAWLDEYYKDSLSYNDENSCDGSRLKECLNSNTDLLIISQILDSQDSIDSVIDGVKYALDNNISILYIHHDGDLKPLGKALFSEVFDIKYEWDNYFKRLMLQDFDILSYKPNEKFKNIQEMFKHFKYRDYEIDWSSCVKDKCDNILSYQKLFLNGAKDTQKNLQELDRNKIDIFSLKDRYRLQKLLVLTADVFRRDVVFPMDKNETDDNIFLRSLYADYSSYNFRSINPTQPDMGNFSRSDFSHIKPHQKVINIKSRKYFKATGVYALPGKSVKITRLDNSDLSVKVFINTLRSTATHEYEKSGYKRPKFLQSPHFKIESNETIKITSAYGGVIELEFDKNDMDVKIEFENIGEHPFWASSKDSETFSKKLQEGAFDWAEIVTDGFEVHSTLQKMKKSLDDKKWTNPQAFAEATKQYISNYPHALAGFKGDGIDPIQEVDSFANEHNIRVEMIDIVKHMNADQATCGYGCSGNPYDAYWSFSPVYHGDLHELGHGLESKRLQFEGFSYHSTTNPYSYYSKSKYYKESGNDPQCQKLPFKELFENIQKSIGEDNSTKYLQDNFWATSNWSHQVLVTIEAMMATQKMGRFENGWHLLSRLHLLDREIKRAKNDWESKKYDLGFSSYSLSEFNDIRKNDWLLISFSFASNADFRDYFDMMGIPYSQKASKQVESFGYEKVPQKFYISTPDGYCKEDKYGKFLDKEEIEFSKSAVFPY